MNLLETLSQTSLVQWTAASDWGYPIVLTSHAVGMALVVGILLMFDFRVLGMGKGISFAAIRSYFRVAWLGLAINLCSGTLLFLANYTAFLHNAAFVTKVSLLLIAAVCTGLLAQQVSDSSEKQASRTRFIAWLCIALWLGAIIAGRIVGYTSVPE